MQPKWHPKSIPPSNTDFLKKTLFSLRKNNDFEGSGDRSWDPKSIKNQSKIHLNLGRPLDVDFSSILVDFGSQDGAKLGWKIDKKSFKKGHEKRARAMPRNKGPRRRAGRAQGRQGRPREFSNPPPRTRGSPPHSLARLNLNASPRGASTKYRTKFQGLDKYLLNAHTPLGGGFIFIYIKGPAALFSKGLTPPTARLS